MLYTYPGYIIWGRTQKCPSAGLANFLDWVTEYFDVRDDTPISITKRDIPLSYMPFQRLLQVRSQVPPRYSGFGHAMAGTTQLLLAGYPLCCQRWTQGGRSLAC